MVAKSFLMARNAIATGVTNGTITQENVYALMRTGRARWRMENETFHTLKKQGYNLEHNYGHGEQHLASVFTMLMLLAFLIDQAKEAVCQALSGRKSTQKNTLWIGSGSSATDGPVL